MKLIDKDALVAEIEKRRDAALVRQHNLETIGQETVLNEMEANELNRIITFINTLEVKDVDLNEEIKLNYNPVDGLEFEEYKRIAKYYFELGLKARIDKELVEEVYSHIDSIKDTADRMTSGNFMHNRAQIKFSANTIANVLELIGIKTQKGK